MRELVPYIADITGTVIFAITGAAKGIQLKLDVLGVIVFGCTVGVGGGMLRDTIIGYTPVSAFRNPIYLLCCIITSVIIFMIHKSALASNRKSQRFLRESVYILHRNVKFINRLIIYCDAVGLGVFTAFGASKGADAGLGALGVILCGTITAVGGGAIRDIFARQIPAVLTSDFYATASLLGGALYCVLYYFDFSVFNTFLAVTLFVTGIRCLAIVLKFKLPQA